MTSARDAELSAFLDGALSAPEEAALRAELARVPALAARLEQLARVDAALRALPSRPVPADLRARLEAKLAAEASARPQLAAVGGRAIARASRRRVWVASFSAAAAAAAAVLWLVVAGPHADHGAAASDRAPLASARAADAPAGAPALAARLEAETRPSDASESSGPAPLGEAALPKTASAPISETLASAANAGAARAKLGSPTGSGARSEPVRDASDLALAAPQEPPLATAEATPQSAAAAGAVSPGSAPLLASTDAPSAEAQPALWIDATDAEAAALSELEPADAGVVSVLDLLGELDGLEAEAS